MSASFFFWRSVFMIFSVILYFLYSFLDTRRSGLCRFVTETPFIAKMVGAHYKFDCRFGASFVDWRCL